MDYGTLGLQANMTASNSPLNQGSQMTGFAFDSSYEMQGRTLKTAGLYNDNFIKKTTVSTGTTSIGAGTRLFLTTTLAPIQKGNTNYLAFGVPFIDLYEGTAAVADSQIYPQQGTAISPTRYTFISGFESQSNIWNSGTSMVYAVTVYNTTGTVAPLYYSVVWKLTEHGRRSAQ